MQGGTVSLTFSVDLVFVLLLVFVFFIITAAIPRQRERMPVAIVLGILAAIWIYWYFHTQHFFPIGVR